MFQIDTIYNKFYSLQSHMLSCSIRGKLLAYRQLNVLSDNLRKVTVSSYLIGF